MKIIIINIMMSGKLGIPKVLLFLKNKGMFLKLEYSKVSYMFEESNDDIPLRLTFFSPFFTNYNYIPPRL